MPEPLYGRLPTPDDQCWADFDPKFRLIFSRTVTAWMFDMRWQQSGIRIFSDSSTPMNLILEGGYPDDPISPLRLQPLANETMSINLHGRGLDHLRRYWPRKTWKTAIHVGRPEDPRIADKICIPTPGFVLQRTSERRLRLPKTDRGARVYNPEPGDTYFDGREHRTILSIQSGANDRASKVEYLAAGREKTITLGALRDWIRREQASFEESLL